jgi:hypothetical protein
MFYSRTPKFASIDIFDTLLVRKCANPHDVFLILRTRLVNQGLINCLPCDFVQKRSQAQKQAQRLSVGPHPQINLIYQCLASDFGWDGKQVEAAQRMEMELEREIISLHPLAKKRIKYARSTEGGQIAFISDMYLPSSFVKELLVFYKLWENGDSLWLSCEWNASKGGGGRLFQVVQSHFPSISFEDWSHSGDHPLADGIAPSRLGIQTKIYSDAILSPRETRWVSRENIPVASFIAGSLRLARMDLEKSSDSNDPEIVACGAAAPLIYAYLDWSIRQALELGLKKLFFISRDGQPFLRIAKVLVAGKGYPITCHYLYGSRLTFMPPETMADELFFQRQIVPGMAVHHSLNQSLAAIGADCAWAHQHLPTCLANLDPQKNLDFNERKDLLEALLSSKISKEVRRLIEVRAAKARAYLRGEGFLPGEPVGIVDTGWRGTIQRYLEDLLESNGIPSFYVGFTDPPDNRPRGRRFGFTNAFLPLPIKREPSCKVLVELFTPADHPQVVGYKEKPGGGFDPVFNERLAVAAHAVEIQRGMIAFAKRMIEVEKSFTINFEDLAKIAIQGFLDFHERPCGSEVGTICRMGHSNQIVDATQEAIIQPMRLSEIFACIRDHRRRPPNWWLQGQSVLGYAATLRAFLLLKKIRWRLKGLDFIPPSDSV